MKNWQITGILLLLVSAAFALSTFVAPLQVADRRGEQSLTSFLEDGLRASLAAKSMELADRYYHHGMDHLLDTAFSNTIFQQLAEELSPRQIVHRQGAALNEILPWLWFSIRFDKGNLKNLLTTVYWLHVTNNSEEANKLLLQAQQNLGAHPALLLERVRTTLILQQPKLATALAESGLKQLDNKEFALEQEEATTLRKQLLTYCAYLYEIAGNTNQAIEAYQKLVVANPKGSEAFANRATALANGNEPSPSAQELINSVLHIEPKCDKHDHDHDHAHSHH